MPLLCKKAFLSIGSNDGWRGFNLGLALSALKLSPFIITESVSSIYEEDFIGAEGPSILTCVAMIRTALSPHFLLSVLKEIESRIGRIKGRRWSPRTIDLDIIDYAGWIYADENLILPHPRFDERPATAAALIEINPLWIHPLKKKPLKIHASSYRILENEKAFL
ncbi:2-amino-4-hydroxy-6-hydroxymethyldihydropteridine diphosphokinase [candidate division WOR-3 bacterium]|nr:2-amino-4-hydroxy-6-hydroxymethyldihydropteridine diphosphokinase [candidate division WOR-3 bacterium]